MNRSALWICTLTFVQFGSGSVESRVRTGGRRFLNGDHAAGMRRGENGKDADAGIQIKDRFVAGERQTVQDALCEQIRHALRGMTGSGFGACIDLKECAAGNPEPPTEQRLIDRLPLPRGECNRGFPIAAHESSFPP